MNTCKTVFSQLMDFLPWRTFRRRVEHYKGNYRIKNFSCADQFLCMAFAQLTFRESLRDIEACLRSLKNKLYHIGIRGTISRSTLADANNTRDWRIYADFAQVLIDKARKLYVNDTFGIELSNTVYALDSTTIQLCISLFPWAAYCKTQAGVRMHTLLDLRGDIPSFIEITDAKTHDVTVLDLLIPEAGSFYIMDRGYLDFTRLYCLDQAAAFFVIRSKKNIKYRRLYSQPVDRTTGLKCDQIVVLAGTHTSVYYPKKVRRIVSSDVEKDSRIIIFTNNMALPALTIAQLYTYRWKIELFFRWIKQHLRIKKFYGISENALKTQIWIAVSVYVLVAIVKKQLNLEQSLYTILQILSVTVFEKIDLYQLFTTTDYTIDRAQESNQLLLFN